MILSASRRTDVPCYYSEWFMTRIRSGFALTRNPMNHSQLSRVPLTPDVVDCIVFWTKDAKNMLPHLNELGNMGYNYIFQFTLAPYGRDIEPSLRGKAEIIDTFNELSNRIGKERVVWRYDPIILNHALDIEYHKEQFLSMSEKLADCTENVVISFVDMYPKLKSKSAYKDKLIREITPDEMAALGDFIGNTAAKFGLRATACCESYDLRPYGIENAGCLDKALIEKACGFKLDIKEDKNQRSGCKCVQSIDIGAYNTCLNGCVYCYANYSDTGAKSRYKSHDANSELLSGKVLQSEKAKLRVVKSEKKL